jgi:hypothetical protein
MVSFKRKSLAVVVVALVAFVVSSLEQVTAAVEVTEEHVKQIMEELSPICKEELKRTFAGAVSFHCYLSNSCMRSANNCR